MEQACLLCRRADTDPELCGLKLEALGVCAHQYCLVFANDLFQRQANNNGLMGFLPEDIHHIVVQAAQKDCFVCSESGATITCRETGCNRNFHYPCALEGECVTQFLPHYRSYCWEHRPQQEPQAAPENTTCLICLEPVDDRTSYGTMVCPACQHAWFHRGCIQGQAMSAGISCFQCPHCRDKDRFVSVMLILGIRVPLRMPLWENNNAYADLAERHSRCDARQCLCPQGREHREGRGPWQLFLCRSCAAEGTHRGCFGLRTSGALWECDSCAGLGTASSASLELADLSTASRAASGPSQSSLAPESSSSSTASQEAPGPSLGSPAPETTSPSTTSQSGSGPSHSSLALETSSPSTTRPVALGPSHSSPVLETSSPSTVSPVALGLSHSSPVLETSSPSTVSPVALGLSHISPVLETSSPSTISPVALGLSHSSPVLETSSPSTISPVALGPSHSSPVLETSSPSTASPVALGPSHSSPVLETSSPSTASPVALGPSHSSPVLETSSPSTASLVALGPSHRSLAEETSSPSTTSQLPSGSSSTSPELESSGRSSHAGPVRTRGRSRLQREAQNPYSRPGRRRGTSRGPSSSSDSSTPSQEVPGPSGSPVPESSSPSNANQEASGPSHSSVELESSSPSTDRQEPRGSCSGTPELENGGRSSSIGPVRTRDRSRLQRRAQNPYSRPRRHSERSGTPAPSAESSTHGQELLGPSHLSPIPESISPSTASLEASGPSHSSLAEETSSPSTTSQLPSGSSSTSPELESSGRSSHAGPVRTRGRSRLQREAQNPYSRPRRRRGTSRGPSSSAESSTPSQDVPGPSISPVPETSSPSNANQEASGPSHGSVELEASIPSITSQLPSGSSYASPEPENGGRSSSAGPVQTRHRSQLQRRAQNPYSRPRRHSERSGTPAPSAESSSHGQELLGPSHLSPIPESNSPSTDSEESLGSSSNSTEQESGQRSSHAGPVRTRGRSRLQRRAEHPYSRPRRRRGTSRARSPSAGRDPPAPAQ